MTSARFIFQIGKFVENAVNFTNSAAASKPKISPNRQRHGNTFKIQNGAITACAKIKRFWYESVS
jgi:hypothetical protein